jgi:HAD superfamily hydrolase (TIGR01484 family)
MRIAASMKALFAAITALSAMRRGVPGRTEKKPLVIEIVIFDLDGTLAPSKSSIDAEMAALLTVLIGVTKVAIISGGGLPQFQQQLLANLPADQRLDNLAMLPTCGTKFYQYNNGWQMLYSEDLNDLQKKKIVAALEDAVGASGFQATKTWGETIEDRGSQITYSALGQQAPLAEKEKWDPDFSKRKQIQAVLERTLSEFSVRLGGTTSIDVTLPGIDKAYGIRKIRDILGVPIANMLYVGDALFPGGNDYPVRSTGATCIQVRDPDESKRVIEAVVACLKNEETS